MLSSEINAIKTFNKKYYYMMVIYMIVLFASAFIKEIYRYGGYIEVSMCCILYIVSKPVSRKRNLRICLILLLPVLLFSQHSIVYFIVDFASALIVLLAIDLSSNIFLSSSKSNVISWLYIMYLILFLILIADPSRYGGSDNRYIGLLPSSTVASSVLMMLLIGLIEKYKKTEHKFKVFAFCAVIVIVNLFVCRTRSILFVFPYLIYSFYKITINRKLKLLSIFITSGIGIALFFMFLQNADILRLSSADASSLTRLSLYQTEWEIIQEANYVVPSGFQECTIRIQNLTTEDYSPHNDFFRYWVDWGIFWIIYLAVLCKRIRDFAVRNDCLLTTCLVILFIASCALHNVLFYSYIWIPMILILAYNRKEQI